MKIHSHIRERPHNTYAFGGEGGQRFVTKPCKSIGICTVLRYEGGGGCQKSRKIAYVLCGRSLMQTFSKSYANVIEENMRWTIFNFNYLNIMNNNQNFQSNRVSYDLLDAEIRQYLTGIILPRWATLKVNIWRFDFYIVFI